MASDNNASGPTIMWNELRGKKVKSNDGKEVGEIKEVSDNYLRLEKGTIRKEKFWVPKYVADAYDGKSLWLLMGQDEIMSKYAYGTAQTEDEYSRGFETFKSSDYGKDLDLGDFQTIRVVEEKVETLSNNPDEYRNIRDHSSKK